MLCASCSTLAPSDMLNAANATYLTGSLVSHQVYRKKLRFIVHAKDENTNQRFVLLAMPRPDKPWTVNLHMNFEKKYTPYKQYTREFAQDSMQKAAAALHTVRAGSTSPWHTTVHANHEKYHFKTIEMNMHDLQEYAARMNRTRLAALFPLEQIVPMNTEQTKWATNMLQATDSIHRGQEMAQITWQNPQTVTVDAFTWDFLQKTLGKGGNYAT